MSGHFVNVALAVTKVGESLEGMTEFTAEGQVPSLRTRIEKITLVVTNTPVFPMIGDKVRITYEVIEK